MGHVSAVLIDIDGVLTLSWKPIDGAVAALEWLRSAGLPLALVTNTTSRSRESIASTLAGAGFPVTADDVLTAPVIAAGYLTEHYPGARCLLLNSGEIGQDLAGVTLVRQHDPDVDVVLVGGAGAEFSYPALNRAFGCLESGARLVAMHRGLYWRTSDGLQLDSGAFIVGLEQAAGFTAEVVGKPASAFFAAALAHLGASAVDTLMVGDDIENDVLAAQRHGLTGVLVKTGKYLARAHRDAAAAPDHVLGSVADLPALVHQLTERPALPSLVRQTHPVGGARTGASLPPSGGSATMRTPGDPRPPRPPGLTTPHACGTFRRADLHSAGNPDG